MNSVYDTIYEWARKTTTSFSELCMQPRESQGLDIDLGDSLIYRLKRWPDLPSQARTAGVLRTLSVMSSRPVNRQWILSTSRLRADQVDRLLKRLTDEGAVEVIDGSKFPPEDF